MFKWFHFRGNLEKQCILTFLVGIPLSPDCCAEDRGLKRSPDKDSLWKKNGWIYGSWLACVRRVLHARGKLPCTHPKWFDFLFLSLLGWGQKTTSHPGLVVTESCGTWRDAHRSWWVGRSILFVVCVLVSLSPNCGLLGICVSKTLTMHEAILTKTAVSQAKGI